MKIEIGYVMLIQKRKKKGRKQTNRSYVHDSKKSNTL